MLRSGVAVFLSETGTGPGSGRSCRFSGEMRFCGLSERPSGGVRSPRGTQIDERAFRFLGFTRTIRQPEIRTMPHCVSPPCRTRVQRRALRRPPQAVVQRSARTPPSCSPQRPAARVSPAATRSPRRLCSVRPARPRWRPASWDTPRTTLATGCGRAPRSTRRAGRVVVDVRTLSSAARHPFAPGRSTWREGCERPLPTWSQVAKAPTSLFAAGPAGSICRGDAAAREVGR
jgi:hypothetical protein